MLYFPQLSTGAMGQFPLRWTDRFGAITNALLDGNTIVAADAGAAGVTWDISFAGLSVAEQAALGAFFTATQGALNSFTMLDPADNLFAYSQDFTQACWKADPLLTVTPGGADPFGGTTAATLTNSAQTVQSLSQQINGPSGYQYCFSIYMSSARTQNVTLTQLGSGAPVAQTVVTGPVWNRFVLTGATGLGDGVQFGVTLQPGAQVSIACAQTEAQTAASTYKATGSCGGVYQECRFDQDELNINATGPNQYSCAIRISSSVPTPWAV